MSNRMERLLASLENGFLWVASFCVLVTFVLVIFSSSSRLIWVQSSMWPEPVAEYLVLAVTMFAAPIALRTNSHIIVDAAVNAAPERVAAIMLRIANVIGVVTCAVMFHYSLRVSMHAFATGETEVRAIAIPFWYLSGAICMSFGLLAARYAMRVAADMKTVFKGARE